MLDVQQYNKLQKLRALGLSKLRITLVAIIGLIKLFQKTLMKKTEYR